MSGTFTVDGVSQPVRIVRDRWGVPHIYAQNEHDLFFAQGFVQAQDRLFQMDLWRRSSQGRLAEVLGLNFVERDAATRRVQYRGDVAVEWASYGPAVKADAEAFVGGINAWVAEARAHVPEEFTVAGWLPETWSPEDLLNRTDAFVTAGADTDAFRARLVAAIGASRADAWFPAATPYKIPAGLDLGIVGPVVEDALRRAGTAPFFLGLASPVMAPAGRGDGSNAWVVTGARSATSAPLLANDPHRAFAHPSLRYLIHLNAPGWNVIGAASPWLPGVIIGHNEHVAWGMTAFPADVVDIFVEHVDPSNPHRVEHRGRWVDTSIVHDPIKMKGQAKPFPFEREYTPNGVIVATDSERHLAYTLKWSGSEPGAAGELAALPLDRSRSVAEFRSALSRWKLPVVDVLFADAGGLAGRQVAGLIPDRRGWDGALPAPGWSGVHEWRGWLRPDDVRHAMLPRAGGFFVSANQNAARTNRLLEVLGETQAQTIEGFEHLQHDTTAWNAGQLVPLLVPLRATRNDVEASRQRLLQWDRRVSADSTEAALYVFWEEALARLLAERHLEPDLRNDYLARTVLSVPALTKPTAMWFDSAFGAARDRLLVEGLAIAVDRLRAAGAKRDAAVWGDLHSLTFKHPLAITRAARERFNIGPLPLSGYSGTVLSTFPPQDVGAGASFREVVDVSDWDRSVWTQAPGQSGEPGSPHFADLAGPWSMGAYFQMAFSTAAVASSAEATLVLRPR